MLILIKTRTLFSKTSPHRAFHQYFGRHRVAILARFERVVEIRHVFILQSAPAIETRAVFMGCFMDLFPLKKNLPLFKSLMHSSSQFAKTLMVRISL